ncbi:MAG: OstA-like protein [Bacteroidota bacterium]|nr:OstA-like protein [Bacteroidota bacterium]
MRNSFLILPIFLCSFLFTNAQKQIEIIHADDFIFDKNKHPDYTKLIGNVAFKHEGATMKCDSAFQYKNNKMDAFGNIQINQGDTLHLFGKKLFYDGNSSKAIISEKVKLKDKQIQLHTDQLHYNLEKNIAFYPKKGQIQDAENRLFSDKGSYHSRIKLFYFKGNIEVINPKYNILTDTMLYHAQHKISYFFGPTTINSDENIIYCENGWYNSITNQSQFRENATLTHQDFILKGDSISYNRNKGYGKAINNIQLIDSVNDLLISGNLGEYFEETENAMVTQNALLHLIADTDTLFVHADTFLSTKKVEQREVRAFYNVKCFREDMQAKCDSLAYNLKDSTIELFNKPVIWSDKFQITAESIQLLLSGGKIKKMFLLQDPMLISQEDSLHFNQIKGKVMFGFFDKNKLQKIDVKGNGQTIFLVQNDSKKNIGVNISECSDISLFLKENELDGITFHAKPTAIMHPMYKIEEKDKFLKGFLWRANERPNSKADIFIE